MSNICPRLGWQPHLISYGDRPGEIVAHERAGGDQLPLASVIELRPDQACS